MRKHPSPYFDSRPWVFTPGTGATSHLCTRAQPKTNYAIRLHKRQERQHEQRACDGQNTPSSSDGEIVSETKPPKRSANKMAQTIKQQVAVSQRPESELNRWAKNALKVAGMCGNGKINWASVPCWPQDWTMGLTVAGWCGTHRRPRQAFPTDNYASLMSLNCKSTQLRIPGKWNSTFTVLLLPLCTVLLLICNCNIQRLRIASYIAMLATALTNCASSLQVNFNYNHRRRWKERLKNANTCSNMFTEADILSKSH